jgi:hypothetical protein
VLQDQVFRPELAELRMLDELGEGNSERADDQVDLAPKGEAPSRRSSVGCSQ